MHNNFIATCSQYLVMGNSTKVCTGKLHPKVQSYPFHIPFIKKSTHFTVKYPLKNTASLILKILGMKLMINLLGENQALPDTAIRFVCPFKIELRE